MKRFVFSVGVVTFFVSPMSTDGCPVGWEFFYESASRSAGFSFCDRGTHYVGTGAVRNPQSPFLNLLVVDIAAFAQSPYDTLWSRVYESIPGEGRSIIVVPNGLVIAGTIPEYTDSGGPHVLMLMMDDTGNIVWSNSDCQGVGLSVAAAPDGGYLVVGQSYIEHNLLLARYDKEGDTVWTKTYGSGNFDEGCSISSTSDGNYVVTGTRDASATGQNGRLWWLKLNQNADVLWEHSLGATNYDYWGTSIQELDSGGFIIGGGSGEHGVEVDKNLVVIRTDASGNPEWTREHYACLYFADPTPYWVAKTADGGFIATGMGFNLLKLDSAGEIEWERHYSSALSCCVKQTDAGRYVSVGDIDSMFSMIDANEDGWINISEVGESSSFLPEQEVLSSSPAGIILKYANCPDGFHAMVFDASGRKIDEIKTAAASGTVAWGSKERAGVYFIKETSGGSTHKAVLIRR